MQLRRLISMTTMCAVAIALCTVFSSCTSMPASSDRKDSAIVQDKSEGTAPGTRVIGPDTEARLNRVGFLNPNLNRRIAVEQTGHSRTPTNTLEIFAVFRNRTDYPQSIRARCQFFGPGRNPNEGPYEWQTINLPPNSIQTYRTWSRGVDASFYYIEVEELH